jgi:hypothetical protein
MFTPIFGFMLQKPALLGAAPLSANRHPYVGIKVHSDNVISDA